MNEISFKNVIKIDLFYYIIVVSDYIGNRSRAVFMIVEKVY